jgi:hypothetical protein
MNSLKASRASLGPTVVESRRTLLGEGEEDGESGGVLASLPSSVILRRL